VSLLLSQVPAPAVEDLILPPLEDLDLEAELEEQELAGVGGIFETPVDVAHLGPRFDLEELLEELDEPWSPQLQVDDLVQVLADVDHVDDGLVDEDLVVPQVLEEPAAPAQDLVLVVQDPEADSGELEVDLDEISVGGSSAIEDPPPPPAPGDEDYVVRMRRRRRR